MNEKKARSSYTEEQKAEAKKLLLDGVKQTEVATLTGIGKSTIIKIASELKGDNKIDPVKSQSQVMMSFMAELKAVQKRKLEVEELLNGKLKVELDELTEKEAALSNLLQLYKKQ